MFLLIDNYDSFTFNLVQAFQVLGRFPHVVRNDQPELLGLASSPELEAVVISPGPSRPEQAGLCLEFLELLPTTVPVLGICLGHQILGHHAGASVVVGERIMHGKTSPVRHTGEGLFAGLPQPMECGRYHSLLVRVEEAPKLLERTAWTEDGKGDGDGEDEVMGLRYTDRPWAGVQFHPESILTPEGPKLLENFLKMHALTAEPGGKSQ
ncbi:aminodeoxychorismate/anthranilate synthase component II [Desulfonatronum sp. SC1]|uniref:anthranilate synthase component II n=1 Tax=Desulfonatronum sp. SC1 TaxID=2109626 RepID=UPI000D2F7FC4|nr:aminodeoxychorismate/anthranilate synthase component II [Desulfonatronum sp. SC1]PTN37714.1 aminodeoxychorismate/anthranilate synthase component II [Desulfonatronum sp. SC1]